MADSGIEDSDSSNNLKLESSSKMATSVDPYNLAATECAQALLALAHSGSPAAPMIKYEQNVSEDKGETLSADSNSNISYLDAILSDKMPCGTDGSKNRSILKRHLESTPKRSQIKSRANHSPHLAAPLDQGYPDNIKLELMKRIKMDHNYASTSTYDEKFHNQYDGAFNHENSTYHGQNKLISQNGSAEHKAAKHIRSTVGRKSESERNGSCKSRAKSLKGKETAVSSRTDVYNFNNDDSEVQAGWGNNQGSVQPQHAFHNNESSFSKTEKDNGVHNQNVNPFDGSDMYQPDDSKYKNFNLLLKCLTTDDAFDDKSSSRERCDSNTSNLNDVSLSSEDGLPMQENISALDEQNEYQCRCCLKVFQKKRYLTKHIRRMHPELELGDVDKEDMVSCPNCGHPVARKYFKRHSNMCNVHTKKSKKQLEMDLANCQFCGIRMRRHILVKHLAHEHCVETCRDLPGFSAEVDSDSDESTISGSEHDVDDVELASPVKDNTEGDSGGGHSSRSGSVSRTNSVFPSGTSHKILVSCQLCNKELSKIQLTKHLAEEHCVEPQFAPKDNNSSHSGDHIRSVNMCKHSMLHRFLSESSDGGDQETPDLIGNEECQSCVEHLVSHQTPHREGDTPNGQCTTTNASYTIFVTKNPSNESIINSEPVPSTSLQSQAS